MHLKTIIFLFTLVVLSYSGYSQTSFDKLYDETHQALRGSNPKKALSNTNYLYKIAKNDAERIKAYSLKAHILYQYGIHDETITTLKQLDSLATIGKNYSVQARVYGFLSTVYRENEIYNLGKIYLNKAVEASKKIEDKNEMYRFQGNLSQELAYYELSSNNYPKAISYLKKGNLAFEKADSSTVDKNFHTAINDELIAKNYYYTHKIDSALAYYEKAQKELAVSQLADDPLKGYIYNGLGNVYVAMHDNKTAQSNYLKAEQIAETSSSFGLKQEVYNSLMEFYKKTDIKKYVAYNELNLKLSQTEKKNRKVIADELIKTLRKEQVQSESQYQKYKFNILGLCIFTILVTIGSYTYKRKQDYKKIRTFINNNNKVIQNTEIEETAPKKDTAKEYMSEATEAAILKNIQEFERSLLFLNKTLSINSVAAELNTNHRYLSYVISKNKSKDFASYINELRINYIIDHLKNDATYLKYKISYLADQAGFSSHSRFTISFKKITGVSPLTFITYLQNNNNETTSSI
ncbi:AraC family transcriptional regulator [Flavobacterium hercynium]|uniref:HTH araC/xylS-type domain-containing protein n=1 Tax=Flavobacterium hercynium TaxID=387094 RepID=A0A226GRC4_9FLAO|nr:AraC family transcriptional regulator [Flavobacterium hercynium]OXA84098.1 hypothetical protein B0A66_21375 [Flavobacterium hercynium]SMP20923.1 Helix-turn-helix domain-containing protein [Flavobacterium hercynium]